MLSVKQIISSQMLQPLNWKEGKIFKVLFQITPTNVNSQGNANPYVAGGDTLDLTQIFALAAGSPGSVLPTFEAVALVRINSMPSAPGPATQYKYQFCLGSSLSNGTVQVFTGSAAQSPGAELAAGNYPAAVLADTIVGEAYFVMP